MPICLRFTLGLSIKIQILICYYNLPQSTVESISVKAHQNATLDRDYANRTAKVSTSNLDSSTRDLTFHDLNVSGIHTFRNVCVETATIKTGKALMIARRIVVYNNLKSSNIEYRRTLVVDSSIFTGRYRKWDVHFSPDFIPVTHRFLPTPAFFVSPNHIQSLYYFWNDPFIRLYSVVRSSNRLHEGMNNQVLYKGEF